MMHKNPVNILMVDDQPAKLLSYEVILEQMGETLIRANSGKEALAHLLRTDIAVILVDVCMPELDGFELAAMIREHPRLRKTSIILVSGVLAEDDARLKAYDSGAVDYISVPIVPEILRAKVAVFAELYRKTEALEAINRELETRVAERTAELERVLYREQLARRDAESANRLKDEFLATVSHELRTPLHAIAGWTHILRNRNLNAETYARAVNTIERNVKVQGQLIADILDVSRIISGKLRLDLQAVDVRKVLDAALDTLRPEADAKAVRIEAVLAPVGNIVGDSARLQQMFCNLLSNAIKFSPANSCVNVGLTVNEQRIEVTVRDEGPGIQPEFLPYVFERFRQGDSSSTRTHHGLGLGLAIVRHVLEMHGGTVGVSNRTDRSGAIFSVCLRRDAFVGTPQATPGETVAPAVLGGQTLRGVRVLVVDDQADGREVVAALLESFGASVRLAASVQEALTAIECELPDVLLADVEMPGEDGYTLARKLRDLPAECGGRIPAAAVTAYASAEDRARAMSAGFQLHIAKPVQPAELVSAVVTLARDIQYQKRTG